MLRKLAAFLAILAIVAGASATVHGKSKLSAKADHGSSHPEATTPVPIPVQPVTPALNTPEAKEVRGSKHEPFWVSSDRSVSDWIAYGGNLALVVVGIGGIVVAMLTLRKIERQTAATERQVLIQMESLRPRLNVSNILRNTYDEAALGHKTAIDLKISNSGGIPAYGVQVETWSEFIERGAIDNPFEFTDKAKYTSGIKIDVDTFSPQGFQIPFRRSLDDLEIARMLQGKWAICFRLRLTYVALGKAAVYDHAFEIAPVGLHSISRYCSAS